MTIPFYDEGKVVKRKTRRLKPEKQRVAENSFNELIRNEFAVPAKSQFSNSICLVICPDHRKPRLTGDFSGIGGVNDLTQPVEANLPRISDILEFLSKANYIATLDLLKAFWQLKIAEDDIDKTTVSISGMSISFKRANIGLKNVLAVFQNMMMEIFDSEGAFIYIDDIIIVASTLDEFLSRVVNLLRDDVTQPSAIELPTINSLSALKEAVEDTKFELFDTWISKIRQEQLRDVDSNPDDYKDYKYNSDIQLYTNNRGKIVIPDSLKKQTLTIIHGHANVGHPSVTTSVKKLLNSDYFCPNMRKDMINHIKRCPACQKTAHVPKNVIESSGSLWADRPFARINADTIGPLPQDDNGFK
ncbi:hypothetical protein P9112_001604 [Eukaryota sp. TZLM1-RC]